MTDTNQLYAFAQLFRFTLPFLLGLLFFALLKDSNKQLITFSKFYPLRTKAYLYGLNNGEVFLLQYDNNLGRSSKECDICIMDKTVSRVHARINYENGSWQIYDLNSTSGTFVDETKIKHAQLRDGSVIRVGSSTYTFLTQARKAVSY